MNKKINTVYIISKGRPQCRTAVTLNKMKYPGEWYIVCGNNDDTISEYQRIWGKEKILIFDWYKEVVNSNLLDNFGVDTMSSGAVPVRNATRKISEARGELRHWQFDDDYVSFRHINKTYTSNVSMSGKLFEKELYNLAEYAYNSDFANIGFCLGNESFPNVSRKAGRRVFNAHNLPSIKDKFVEWRGRMNDDLINAIDVFNKGKIEMSFRFMNLTLAATQSEDGGNTDIYKLSGTVRKTAYAILIAPSAVRLVIKFGRYHHHVNWDKITPRIISNKYA